MFPTSRNNECSVELPENIWPVIQENGQRKYGGPPQGWDGPPPPKGTEVFIKRLPREFLEWEICPHFSKVGLIYELRLMMDFSGSNRGYAFVKYATKDEASRAVIELNEKPILPGTCPIIVEWSQDNRRLFLSPFPSNFTSEYIEDTLRLLVEGILRATVCQSKSGRHYYAFVEFENHKMAAMARRSLISSGIPGWDWSLCIEWAVPKGMGVTRDVGIYKLYFHNLPYGSSEDDLHAILCGINVTPNCLLSCSMYNSVGVAELSSRPAGEYIVCNLHGAVYCGQTLRVTWSNPFRSSQRNRLRHSSNQEYEKPHSSSKSETRSCSYDAGSYLDSSWYKSSPSVTDPDYSLPTNASWSPLPDSSSDPKNDEHSVSPEHEIDMYGQGQEGISDMQHGWILRDLVHQYRTNSRGAASAPAPSASTAETIYSANECFMCFLPEGEVARLPYLRPGRDDESEESVDVAALLPALSSLGIDPATTVRDQPGEGYGSSLNAGRVDATAAGTVALAPSVAPSDFASPPHVQRIAVPEQCHDFMGFVLQLLEDNPHNLFEVLNSIARVLKWGELKYYTVRRGEGQVSVLIYLDEPFVILHAPVVYYPTARQAIDNSAAELISNLVQIYNNILQGPSFDLCM